MNILPRVEIAACVVRVGGFENGFESYGSVGRWLESNGYQMSGPPREVFIVPPRPDRIEETVCEIQLPITMERPSYLSLASN